MLQLGETWIDVEKVTNISNNEDKITFNNITGRSMEFEFHSSEDAQESLPYCLNENFVKVGDSYF